MDDIVVNSIRALFNGVSYGMILVLMSIGLSLVFGLMGVANFAHGEFYALGAYMGFFAFGLTGNFIVAMLASVLAVAAVGGAIEATTIRPLYGRDPLIQIPATFGLAIVMVEVIRYVWGSTSHPFPVPELLSGTYLVGGMAFSTYRSFLIVAGTALTILMWLFLVRTQYGLVIRGAIFDKEMVESMGYRVSRAYTLLFGLGAAYAAIAGVLIAPLFGVFPGMGTQMILLAFIVVILGGMGSFKGPILAGLLIGVLFGFGQMFVGAWAEVVPYALMILVLVYRPRGLFGTKGVFQ
ncbi:branched-chain amino acid ABC transporter permease [Natrarchaeobius oligotrophus]|nr:branched-chain amino acid ABC transporter permease [Natrarchaeobius chitinivorans]